MVVVTTFQKNRVQESPRHRVKSLENVSFEKRNWPFCGTALAEQLWGISESVRDMTTLRLFVHRSRAMPLFIRPWKTPYGYYAEVSLWAGSQ